MASDIWLDGGGIYNLLALRRLKFIPCRLALGFSCYSLLPKPDQPNLQGRQALGLSEFKAGSLENPYLSDTVQRCLDAAQKRLLEDCKKGGGLGVIDVKIEIKRGEGVPAIYVGVSGTSIKSSEAIGSSEIFSFAGSAGDLYCLARAGFVPGRILAGACYSRSLDVNDVAGKVGPLPRITEKLRDVQELALSRMTFQARESNADGVIDTKLKVYGKEEPIVVASGSAVYRMSSRVPEPLLGLALVDE